MSFQHVPVYFSRKVVLVATWHLIVLFIYFSLFLQNFIPPDMEGVFYNIKDLDVEGLDVFNDHQVYIHLSTLISHGAGMQRHLIFLHKGKVYNTIWLEALDIFYAIPVE